MNILPRAFIVLIAASISANTLGCSRSRDFGDTAHRLGIHTIRDSGTQLEKPNQHPTISRAISIAARVGDCNSRHLIHINDVVFEIGEPAFIQTIELQPLALKEENAVREYHLFYIIEMSNIVPAFVANVRGEVVQVYFMKKSDAEEIVRGGAM